MHILILDEIDGRIVVRDNGGISGGNSKSCLIFVIADIFATVHGLPRNVGENITQKNCAKKCETAFAVIRFVHYF